jgi:hypothetical protein
MAIYPIDEKHAVIKVFGEHDEKTVQQLWTCMGVGSAAAFVSLATTGDRSYRFAWNST